MSLGQIERTGQKRRRKRLILILVGGGALALGGLVVTALGPASGLSAPTPEPAPVEPEFVTGEAADQAMSEAEALQVLVSDLGTAVVEAGIRDMAPLEILLARVVDVAAAADEMVEAVDLGAEDSARSARERFNVGTRESKASVETVLQQLRAAGVDVASWQGAAPQ